MLYIDDIPIARNNLQLIIRVKHQLSVRYVMKNFSSVQSYLGIDFCPWLTDYSYIKQSIA